MILSTKDSHFLDQGSTSLEIVGHTLADTFSPGHSPPPPYRFPSEGKQNKTKNLKKKEEEEN